MCNSPRELLGLLNECAFSRTRDGSINYSEGFELEAEAEVSFNVDSSCRLLLSIASHDNA
jgi:hypothetical protein